MCTKNPKVPAMPWEAPPQPPSPRDLPPTVQWPLAAPRPHHACFLSKASALMCDSLPPLSQVIVQTASPQGGLSWLFYFKEPPLPEPQPHPQLSSFTHSKSTVVSPKNQSPALYLVMKPSGQSEGRLPLQKTPSIFFPRREERRLF